MKIEAILHEIRKGRKFKRKHWSIFITSSEEHATLTNEELLADDWELYSAEEVVEFASDNKRKIVQIATTESALVVLADDNTLWEQTRRNEWIQLDGLPDKETIDRNTSTTTSYEEDRAKWKEDGKQIKPDTIETFPNKWVATYNLRSDQNYVLHGYYAESNEPSTVSVTLDNNKLAENVLYVSNLTIDLPMDLKISDSKRLRLEIAKLAYPKSHNFYASGALHLYKA